MLTQTIVDTVISLIRVENGLVIQNKESVSLKNYKTYLLQTKWLCSLLDKDC